MVIYLGPYWPFFRSRQLQEATKSHKMNGRYVLRQNNINFTSVEKFLKFTVPHVSRTGHRHVRDIQIFISSLENLQHGGKIILI
jgi:hypothetical protein